MDITPGTTYRLPPAPTGTYVGHTENTHYTVTLDGQTVRLRWDSEVKASDTIEPPGDDTESPPIVHVAYLEPLADALTEVSAPTTPSSSSTT